MNNKGWLVYESLGKKAECNSKKTIKEIDAVFKYFALVTMKQGNICQLFADLTWVNIRLFIYLEQQINNNNKLTIQFIQCLKKILILVSQ